MQKDILRPLISRGKIKARTPAPKEIRDFVISQVSDMGLELG